MIYKLVSYSARLPDWTRKFYETCYAMQTLNRLLPIVCFLFFGHKLLNTTTVTKTCYAMHTLDRLLSYSFVFYFFCPNKYVSKIVLMWMLRLVRE